ncbi:MAG TPA: hypothetical protein VKF41_05130 [Bryobacteraceae bacterium]|nr:hypothetical protein [Bryobacteraceae bacterium]
MPGESSQLPSLPQRIRQAVASGEFPKARLLWEEYGESFRTDRLRGPLPLSRLAEARELAAWTRMAALSARAHAQARLNQIAVAQKYARPQIQPRTRITATF